jgi:peptidoglycan-associated lipoprotein
MAFVLGVGTLAVLAACGGNPEPAPPPGPDPDSLAAAQAEQARLDSIRRAEEARRDSIRRAEQMRADSIRRAEERARAETQRVRGMIMARIHFDFNRSDIRPGDAEILDQKLALLQANPMVRVRIEGHCDERGSDEYNLALGLRRANAAKDYLVSRGIAPERVEVASFGEERPLVAESNEDAWTQNRRDEFIVTGGGDRLVMGR